MNTTQAATFLAPYLSNETAAARYATSLTLLNLYGTVERQEGTEAYSLIVTRDGGTTRVTWNVQTLEPAQPYQVCRLAYWRKKGWSASFRSEKAAEKFASEKLDVLRKWAAKRCELAA